MNWKLSRVNITNSGKNVLKFTGKQANMTRGEADMQIDCPSCSGKSTIYSRRKMDTKVADLYCSCRNPECGHTFVMQLVFSHTLSPSQEMAKNNIINLLRQMPRDQLEMIKAAI